MKKIWTYGQYTKGAVLLVGIIGFGALMIYLVTKWQYNEAFRPLANQLLPDYEKDLKATWGQYGDYLGGVLNPLFSMLTLFALMVTIVLQAMQLDAAKKELLDAKRSSALTQRAWVTNFHMRERKQQGPHGNDVEVTLEWKNFGQTPALKCQFVTQFFPTPAGQLPTVDKFISDGLSEFILAPGQTTFSHVRIPAPLIKESVDGAKSIWIIANAHYHDIFDPSEVRCTGVCLDFTVLIDTDKLARISLLPTGPHNFAT